MVTKCVGFQPCFFGSTVRGVIALVLRLDPFQAPFGIAHSQAYQFTDGASSPAHHGTLGYKSQPFKARLRAELGDTIPASLSAFMPKVLVS